MLISFWDGVFTISKLGIVILMAITFFLLWTSCLLKCFAYKFKHVFSKWPGLLHRCPWERKHESDVNSSNPLSHGFSEALMMSFRLFFPYVVIPWETWSAFDLILLLVNKSLALLSPCTLQHSLTHHRCLRLWQNCGNHAVSRSF